MSHNISVRLSDSQMEFLRLMSDDSQVNTSEILRYLIYRYASEVGQVPQQEDCPHALRAYLDDGAERTLRQVCGSSSVSKSLRCIIDHYAKKVATDLK